MKIHFNLILIIIMISSGNTFAHGMWTILIWYGNYILCKIKAYSKYFTSWTFCDIGHCQENIPQYLLVITYQCSRYRIVWHIWLLQSLKKFLCLSSTILSIVANRIDPIPHAANDKALWRGWWHFEVIWCKKLTCFTCRAGVHANSRFNIGLNIEMTGRSSRWFAKM